MSWLSRWRIAVSNRLRQFHQSSHPDQRPRTRGAHAAQSELISPRFPARSRTARHWIPLPEKLFGPCGLRPSWSFASANPAHQRKTQRSVYWNRPFLQTSDPKALLPSAFGKVDQSLIRDLNSRIGYWILDSDSALGARRSMFGVRRYAPASLPSRSLGGGWCANSEFRRSAANQQQVTL